MTFQATFHDIKAGKMINDPFSHCQDALSIKWLISWRPLFIKEQDEQPSSAWNLFLKFSKWFPNHFKIPRPDRNGGWRHIISVVAAIIRSSIPGACDVSSFNAAVWLIGRGCDQLNVLHWAKSTGFETWIFQVTLEKSLINLFDSFFSSCKMRLACLFHEVLVRTACLDLWGSTC